MTHFSAIDTATETSIPLRKLRDASFTTKYSALLLLATQQNFKKFLAFSDICNLEALLQKYEDFTIFAPTDSAFDGGQFSRFGGDLETWTVDDVEAFIGNLVIPQRSRFQQFLGRRTWAATLSGKRMLIDAVNRPYYCSAAIIATDIQAADGTIHLIDDVPQASLAAIQ